MTRWLIILFIGIPCCFAEGQIKNDSLHLSLKQANSEYELASTSIALARSYLYRDLDSSFFYCQKAMQHAVSIQNDSLIAIAYQNLGNTRLLGGNFDQALEQYILGVQQIENKQFPEIEQALLNNMGIVFDRKTEYGKAREYYLRSGALLDGLKTKMGSTPHAVRMSKLYTNVGATYESEDDTGQAMEYYIKAINIAEEFNIADQQAVVYSNIGSLYLHNGKYDLARTNYMEALKIHESLHNKIGIALMKMHIGELFFNQQDYDSTILYLNESAALAQETRSTATVFYASKILHQVYGIQGEYEKAYKELLRYKTLNDSLFNIEKTKALERLELEYLFQSEKNKLIEEQKRRTLWNYGLAATIFMLLVIFVLVYRNIANKSRITKLNNEYLSLNNKHLSLEKQSLEETLDYKNKELTTNVMYLMKNNEFINSVSERLMSMKGKFKKENQKDINKITLDLQKAAQQDVWEDFETHFSQVHSEFYTNLSKKHTDLTPNERKLCAFLRLNLSTKEISSITQQSNNTLQVARTRLRKKLNLDSSENMTAYLGQF